MSMALAILHATALDAGQLAFQQALILVSAAYRVWILVAIWRCAPNASLLWGTLARWPTVAWGLNTAFVFSSCSSNWCSDMRGGEAPAPENIGAEPSGLRRLLLDGAASLFPGYFALVMATGVMAIACHLMSSRSQRSWHPAYRPARKVRSAPRSAIL